MGPYLQQLEYLPNENRLKLVGHTRTDKTYKAMYGSEQQEEIAALEWDEGACLFRNPGKDSEDVNGVGTMDVVACPAELQDVNACLALHPPSSSSRASTEDRYQSLEKVSSLSILKVMARRNCLHITFGSKTKNVIGHLSLPARLPPLAAASSLAAAVGRAHADNKALTLSL